VLRLFISLPATPNNADYPVATMDIKDVATDDVQREVLASLEAAYHVHKVLKKRPVGEVDCPTAPSVRKRRRRIYSDDLNLLRIVYIRLTVPYVLPSLLLVLLLRSLREKQTSRLREIVPFSTSTIAFNN